MASSPLLSLPAELRLHIYSFVGPRSSIRHFTGLLLTCKTLHDEVEHEIYTSLKEHVEAIAEDIRSTGDEILYTAPTTLHGWLNLTVSRPIRSKMLSRDDPYLQFLDVSLETLTITFHDPLDDFDFRSDRRDPFHVAVFGLAKYVWRNLSIEWSPAPEKLVLDWSAYPQEYDPLQGRGRWYTCGDTWKLEIPKIEGNLATGASFYKISGLKMNKAKGARRDGPEASEVDFSRKRMVLGDMEEDLAASNGELTKGSTRIGRYVSRNGVFRWIERVREKSIDIWKPRS